MGLLTIIKKQKLKEREIRCLILGLDNSGKSTIVNQLLPAEEQDGKITPTVGFQIHTVDCYGPRGEEYHVSVWDVGGQTTLRPFWDNYFDKTDILLWCVDASLSLRFGESFQELKSMILRDEDRIGYECQVIVLLNKIDLLPEDHRDTVIQNIKSDIIERLGVHVKVVDDACDKDSDTMRGDGVGFLECSGLLGDGIDQLKRELIRERLED